MVRAMVHEAEEEGLAAIKHNLVAVMLNEQLGWKRLTAREADSGIESINNTDFGLGGCLHHTQKQYIQVEAQPQPRAKLLSISQSTSTYEVLFLDLCDLHYLTSLRYKYGGRGL